MVRKTLSSRLEETWAVPQVGRAETMILERVVQVMESVTVQSSDRVGNFCERRISESGIEHQRSRCSESYFALSVR